MHKRTKDIEEDCEQLAAHHQYTDVDLQKTSGHILQDCYVLPDGAELWLPETSTEKCLTGSVSSQIQQCTPKRDSSVAKKRSDLYFMNLVCWGNRFNPRASQFEK
ncbi:hypothetical protein BsWGS_15774 [Bradybaena similaris]